MFFDGVRLSSQRGVQQGDPLGPLLFPLALQPILRRLAALRGESGEVLDVCFAYLDDCVFAGSHSVVRKAIELLRDASKEIGLELNWTKCKWISTSSQTEEIESVSALPGCPLSAACGFKLLGSPIGSKDFCTALTNKRVLKNESLLQAIGDLEDPQAALLLLRSCASFGKIAFSLRTTPGHLHEEAVRDFDESVRACFEEFSGLHPNASQWK